MSTTKLPSFIYIRAGMGGSNEALFLVEGSLFNVAGSLPDGCTLKQLIVGPGAKPMGEKDGLPIYGLGVPAVVFSEMLHGMRFMDLLPDMYEHLPRVIKANGMNLATWRQYLTYYGLAVLPPDTKEEKKRPKKKQKKLLEETPHAKYIQNLTVQLASWIKEQHPEWAEFRSGAQQDLECVFVHTRSLKVDNDRTTWLEWDDGTNINHSIGAIYAYELVGDEDELVEATLLRELGCEKTHTANIHMFRNEKSRAKKPDVITDWPASRDGQEVLFTPGDHLLVRLTIEPNVEFFDIDISDDESGD